MSYITLIWYMVASACLTLAGMHVLVWLKKPQHWASCWFAVAAVAIAGTAAGELVMMRSVTPEAYGTALRWAAVPSAVMILSIIGFVHVSFRTGRRWLAWTAVGLRLVTLILHFTSGQSAIYREIVSLRPIQFLGETVSVVAETVPNPWVVLTSLSNLAFLAYVVDATVSLWRVGGREQRGRALRLGGSLVVFIMLAGGLVALVNHRVIQAPYIISVPFLMIVLMMSYEISRDLQRTQDIDRALRQTEFYLRESELRLKLAIESAELGFWSWRLHTDSIWGTERAKAMFGFAPETVVTFAMVQAQVHPEDRATLQAAVAAAMKSQGGYRAEYRLLLPDGQLVWISAHGSVSVDESGNPAAMTGVVINITERRASELAMAQQRDELARLSRMSMLGELSGSLAHELNQPLTAILFNAQAAQRLLDLPSPDHKELRTILADIASEDKRAGEIIRGLRLLIKRGELRREPLEVNELVAETLRLTHSDLVNHGCVVQTELAPDLPRIAGDRVQLQQILINLLMNASDAMAEGDGEDRRIVITSDLHEGGGVRVTVSDCGKGIAPGKLERIFEPLYTDKPNGLGLGLAVCRTIVTAHGGRLWASNNPGGGASIHFILPVKGRSQNASVNRTTALPQRFNPASAGPWEKA